MMRAFLVVLFAATTVAFGFGGASAQEEPTAVPPVEAECDPRLEGASGCDDTVPSVCTEAGVPCQEEETPTTEGGTGPLGEGCDPTTEDCAPVVDFFDFYCDDFPSQADAQAAYDVGGLIDIEKLDPDRNGIACDHETEPTPEPAPSCTPDTCLDGANATVVYCDDPASECEETLTTLEPTAVPTEGVVYAEPTPLTDDGATLDAAAEPAPAEVDAVEPSTDAEVDADAPADVDVAVAADSPDEDREGGNGSVALPRTGVGFTDKDGSPLLPYTILAWSFVMTGWAIHRLTRREVWR